MKFYKISFGLFFLEFNKYRNRFISTIFLTGMSSRWQHNTMQEMCRAAYCSDHCPECAINTRCGNQIMGILFRTQFKIYFYIKITIQAFTVIPIQIMQYLTRIFSNFFTPGLQLNFSHLLVSLQFFHKHKFF